MKKSGTKLSCPNCGYSPLKKVSHFGKVNLVCYICNWSVTGKLLPKEDGKCPVL